LILWLACTSPEEPPPVLPELTLVSIETLRADHLQGWGYERDTMPNLHRVEGRRYLQARSTAPWTLPSMTSMLTGLQAAEHGVETHDSVLPQEVQTLAEDLGEAGYQTAFFGVNELFVDGRDLEQGFDVWQGVNGWSADRLMRSVEAFLAERSDPRPLFLVVHFFEPHCPYHAPRDLQGHFRSEPGPQLTDEQWSTMSDCYRADRDLHKTLDAYDEELLAVDRVLPRLKRDGIVAYVGDHGEAFWEHGDYGHGRQVYAEAIHVPLIVEGLSGETDALVSTAWIAGTFRELAGLEAERTLDRGASAVVSATRNEGLDRKVVAEGDLRLFLDGDQTMLLEADEATPVDDPSAVARLSAALPTPGSAGHRPLSEQAWERLRALGYTE